MHKSDLRFFLFIVNQHHNTNTMFPLTHANHILPSTYADSRLCKGAHDFVLYPILASFEMENEFKFFICRHSLDSKIALVDIGVKY